MLRERLAGQTTGQRLGRAPEIDQNTAKIKGRPKPWL
jgi:hypothetical protein